MPDEDDFFKQKKPWSKYKDLIFDYYLKPYLAKVAHIGRPIAIIDCFAGPGIFGDGELGSPLIIAKHLSRLHRKGRQVMGMFIETDSGRFAQLESNLSSYQFPVRTRQGDFLQFVDEIAELADCGPPNDPCLGACCGPGPDYACTVTTSTTCSQTYKGDGTSCATNICDPPT